jgi:hypothetical protein
MSIIQKQYFTLESQIIPPYDPWDPSPNPITPTSLLNPICTANLPDWFINSNKNFKKIIRVLGCSVGTLPTVIPEPNLEEDIIKPGFRLYSNINPRSNILMKTSATVDDAKNCIFQDSQNIGFIMMINNYNSTKEFDITDDNINEVKFYIRYWSSSINLNFILDAVVELELLIVDDIGTQIKNYKKDKPKREVQKTQEKEDYKSLSQKEKVKKFFLVNSLIPIFTLIK